jgi:hypothetical protein
MEQDMKGKAVEWSSVVEYFTKRGRPSTNYEIEKLKAEDRRIREEQEEEVRAQQDQENRRHQRLMDDLKDGEDFEAFQ